MEYMGNISQTIDAIINERKKRLIIIEDAIKKVDAMLIRQLRAQPDES